jgi:hypothetical protein
MKYEISGMSENVELKMYELETSLVDSNQQVLEIYKRSDMTNI